MGARDKSLRAKSFEVPAYEPPESFVKNFNDFSVAWVRIRPALVHVEVAMQIDQDVLRRLLACISLR